jgi:hypothetical protein
MKFAITDIHTSQTRTVDAGEIRRLFDEDGVVVFPRFFTDAELDTVNRELADYFAPIEEESKSRMEGEAHTKYACDVIPWNPCGDDHNQVFLDLREHDKFVEATEAALGEGFSAPSSLVMYSVGGGRGQAWHQDCPSDDSDAFNLNRLIYTHDVKLEDGAIVFVPGSHKQGRIPPGDHQELMPGEITLEPEAGTLVFLHGHVYHRVTPNLNQKPRISVNYRAYPAGVDPDVNCIGVYRNGEVNFCDKRKNHDGTPAMAGGEKS